MQEYNSIKSGTVAERASVVTKTFRRPGRIAALVLVFALASGLLAQATRLRSLNIEEMTDKAGRIVSGRCLDVVVERDPALGTTVTRVTLEVDRSLKGTRERTLTFTMIGAQDPAGTRTSTIGMPRFVPGEEVVVFLYPPSAAGLTSPVGLGQGKFVKLRDKNGQVRALNSFGNRALFRGLSAEATRRLGSLRPGQGAAHAVRSDDLIEMIERLRRGRE